MFPLRSSRPLIYPLATGTAAFFAFAVFPTERGDPTESSSLPNEAGLVTADARSAGADEPWWDAVSSQIARSEYEPKATAAGLQAPNRAQNLRTTFGARGIEVEPRTTKEEAPAWRFHWETSGIGRAGLMQSVEAVSPEPSGDRVAYHHEGWTEWYVNRANGLEQGFTIERRPAGEGPLRIAGNVPEEMKAEVREDGAIDFIESHGACAIRYGELHVWDAKGTSLPSELAVAGSELAIVIDDRNAEYPLLVDPLMTSPAWTAEGDHANGNFGYSVRTAGDVNGDGFSDVIVGAHVYDNPEQNEGRVFVYHGSASGLSATAAWTAESNQAQAMFGISAATAGDVNGDGFDDVIVGAQSFDNPQIDEGRAFVYHGSASGLSPTANWTAESDLANSWFGSSVATAGDVNGDGFDDVIVGANQSSRAYLYHGSSSGLSSTANWTGNEPFTWFGNSVASAGDVNGDGYSDVIVGAHAAENGQAGEGKAYVYHGSSGGLSSTANWTAESNQVNAYFGVSVSTAGDVNGDGYSDVIVGAHGAMNNEVNEGKAYVYHGSTSGLNPNVDWSAESNQVNAYFGVSVSTAGDVNGDGYADVIVGAYQYDNGQTDEGRAFVYHGSAGGLIFNIRWSGESDQPSAGYGFSVATAGDVNGDGFSDVIVSAHFFDNGQTDEGRAFVYHGAPTGLANPPVWTAQDGQSGSDFGESVASAGDVNGDGYSDVIVGAWMYDNGQADEGRAFVYHGTPEGLNAVAAWSAECDQVSAWFARSVATAGDVNGDGFSDVIVGASNSSGDLGGEGRAFVYHGSATGLSTSPAWISEGNQAGSDFGWSVATAGDVNGDGFSDVIVGAWFHDGGQTFEGRAYVYHGAAGGLASTPAWTREGNAVDARYGVSVSTAGDVNGDGFSDVIVGANHMSNGQLEEGRAFVYHGSASGLSTSAASNLESNQAGAEFGMSVATAGDVNGDGFSDVIVGAYLYDNGQTNEGRAFVFHGSATGLNIVPVWTQESDQADAWYSFSVSSAGDVNGDGYSDVIVGAEDYIEVNEEGRAWVYHGSAGGVSIAPAFIANSTVNFSELGHSVASAGDVNGDGYADVIIGAPGSRQAFVHLGNGGDGIDRLVRQARSDDTALISLLGRSDSPSAFRLRSLGRTAAGRGNVRLQAEVKPLGVPFNGSGLVTGFVSNTGTPSVGGSGVPLSELMSGLSANTVFHWRLRTVSDSPFFPRSPWFSHVGNAPSEADIRVTGATVAVADPSRAATHLWLAPNAPNPFTEETQVAYTLPERGRVRLAVYDVAGRQVAVLADGIQDGGRHNHAWDGRASRGARMSAGVYFVRLEFDGRTEARKMVLTR